MRIAYIHLAVSTQSQFVELWEASQTGFANLKGLAVITLGPRLVLVHILAPHPPFVFDAKGTEVRPKSNFVYFDGSDFMEKVGAPADYETAMGPTAMGER